MASAIARIMLVLLLVTTVVPTPAAAVIPEYGQLVCMDVFGNVIPGTIPDNAEVRFVLTTANVPDNHRIVVDISLVHAEDRYNYVPLVRDAGGVYDCVPGMYFTAVTTESWPEGHMYRWNDTTAGIVGQWQFVDISPVRWAAPVISEPLVGIYDMDRRMIVRFNITWGRPPAHGYQYTVHWIPREGEPFVRGFFTDDIGTHEYNMLSGDIHYGTPGWISITAISANGMESTITRPLPGVPPTQPPTQTSTVTVVPTTVVPTTTTTVTVVPTVIPSGILTYSTPLPTISPTPEVTPVPVGTLAYDGIPRWSSGFRLQALPLPTMPGPYLGAAPQPVPVYIDAPQWRNFSVPNWLHDPVPVVGPGAGVTAYIDSAIDASVATLISPLDAIANPIVVWIAKLGAGVGDAIGALGTWISGIAIYARGFGDCFWVLIPLPVWIVAAIALWWRLLNMVLKFLSSEQYTWLFGGR